MVRLYRLKFEKALDNSFEALRLFCLCFWGPTILIECLITMSFYTEIIHGCALIIPDGFLNVIVYVLIIFTCISITVAGFICFSGYQIGRTIKNMWPEIRNARNNVQALPDEEAQSIVASRRGSINLDSDFDIPNNNSGEMFS